MQVARTKAPPRLLRLGQARIEWLRTAANKEKRVDTTLATM